MMTNDQATKLIDALFNGTDAELKATYDAIKDDAKKKKNRNIGVREDVEHPVVLTFDVPDGMFTNDTFPKERPKWAFMERLKCGHNFVTLYASDISEMMERVALFMSWFDKK